MILTAEVVGLFQSFVALGFKTGKKVAEAERLFHVNAQELLHLPTFLTGWLFTCLIASIILVTFFSPSVHTYHAILDCSVWFNHVVRAGERGSCSTVSACEGLQRPRLHAWLGPIFLLPSISIIPLASSYCPLLSQDGWHREWRSGKVQVLVNLLIGNHSAQDENA